MVELHYRDGWPVARYADALGVTSDKLHAHCQREKNCGPRAIIHERLVREACIRLQQPISPSSRSAMAWVFAIPPISTASSENIAGRHRGITAGRSGWSTHAAGRPMRRGRELRMQNVRPHAIHSQSEARDLLAGKGAQGGPLVFRNDTRIAQDSLFRVTYLKRSNRKESGIGFPFRQA